MWLLHSCYTTGAAMERHAACVHVVEGLDYHVATCFSCGEALRTRIGQLRCARLLYSTTWNLLPHQPNLL